MGKDVRSPEDDQELKKLEQKLSELKSMTPPTLEILCSCSFRPHLEEPSRMSVLPPPNALWSMGNHPGDQTLVGGRQVLA